jgi:hypothetical protein
MIGVGMEVYFRSHVFEPPFVPYYNSYMGHKFEVVRLHYNGTHVELRCIDDPSVKVAGYVHPEDLKRA